jgi:hypothetical protein
MARSGSQHCGLRASIPSYEWPKVYSIPKSNGKSLGVRSSSRADMIMQHSPPFGSQVIAERLLTDRRMEDRPSRVQG